MRLRFRGTGGKLFDVLAPGLYAWGITVGRPVSQRFAPLGARICALVALVALVAGSALVFTSPRLSRAFGIWVFLAACIATWAAGLWLVFRLGGSRLYLGLYSGASVLAFWDWMLGNRWFFHITFDDRFVKKAAGM